MYDQGYQGPYREPEEQEAYQGSYGQTVTAQSLDVYRTLSFGPGEFLGGAMYSIDEGGEVISLPLPAEAESGQQFKYEGCGMADPATGLRGDLYVTLEFYQAVEKKSSGKKLWWLWIVAVLAVLALLASFLLISLPDKKPVRPGRDRDDRVSEEREEEDRENETEEAAPWEETGDVDTTEAETWEQSHVHSWVGPTCTDPQTCTACGQVEGEPLGHSWTEATVERPRTCTVCGATDGAPLDPISLLEPGDIFEFGYYGNEPIRWKVLEKQADKLLVISQYGLDCVPYDDQDRNDYSPDPVTWEESYIRNWLNGHFYDNAFTREEKDKIGAVAWDGIDDKVFLLSYSQVQTYLPTAADRRCSATAFAVANNAYQSGGCWWWVRTNESTSKVTSINSDGSVDPNTRLNGWRGCARPAIWISFS